MSEQACAHADPEPARADVQDMEAVTTAVLTASRVLVAISARSLAAVQDTVTLPQFRALVILASRGPLKLIALAEQLAVNPSTAMRMVDRLAASDMVDRQVNPDNRREVILRLTSAGQKVVDEVTARRRDEIAAVVARIPPDQRAGLVTALQAFARAGEEPSATIAGAQGAQGAQSSPLGWE